MERFKGVSVDDDTLKEIINMKKQILEYGDLVTDAQQNEVDAIINSIVQLQNQKIRNLKSETVTLTKHVKNVATNEKTNVKKIRIGR